MSKGSLQRPFNQEVWDREWHRIFGKKKLRFKPKTKSKSLYKDKGDI